MQPQTTGACEMYSSSMPFSSSNLAKPPACDQVRASCHPSPEPAQSPTPVADGPNNKRCQGSGSRSGGCGGMSTEFGTNRNGGELWAYCLR